MEILIKSEKDAVKVVQENPNKFFVVSIRGFNHESAPIDEYKDKCKDMIVANFDDVVDSKDYRYNPPTIEDVRRILDWTDGKNDILVHCYAGISRSSAIAYLIEAKRTSVKEAIKILNWYLHWPNELILQHGAKILNDQEVINAIRDWEFVERLKRKLRILK